mmetsp:Transcript_31927/g.28285  ORF Transcript_31927/g.28285 Transcript_31927/m.28285 type:complete len:83 (-) Transcript_31927:25-273(-)
MIRILRWNSKLQIIFLRQALKDSQRYAKQIEAKFEMIERDNRRMKKKLNEKDKMIKYYSSIFQEKKQSKIITNKLSTKTDIK